MTPPPLFLSPRLERVSPHDAVCWWAWPQAVLDVALEDHPVGLGESESLVVGDQSVAIRDEPVRKFELGLVGQTKYFWKTGTNSTGNFGPKGDCSLILSTFQAYLATCPELQNWPF